MSRNLWAMAQQTAGLVVLPGLLFAGAAQAATGNHIAWLWADQPNATSGYTPSTAYSYNSNRGAIRVIPEGTGIYQVRIKRVYHGQPDDIQVTAYDSNHYCSEGGWSPSGKTLITTVDCYDASGAPANSYFTLLYQARLQPQGSANRGFAFLWANEPSSSSYTPSTSYQYNSTGGTNTVSRSSPGVYLATLPGLTKTGGDVQVTAYNTNGRCKVEGWSNDTAATHVSVLCYDSTGAPADEFFDLAFALNEDPALSSRKTAKGAYAWANQPSSTTTYRPSKTYSYNGFGTGRLKAVKNSTGNYTVSIPGTLLYNTSNVLVTGYGSDSGYCNILNWGTKTMNVGCYAQGGAPIDSYFDVSFHTANN